MPPRNHVRAKETGYVRVSVVLAITMVVALLTFTVSPWGRDSSSSPGVQAAGGDFSLDFIAAAPDDYNHLTTPAVELAPGGLQYDSRAINANVVEQLEAEDFACEDTIVFFTQVTVDDGASGTQSIDLHYDFDAINNGQPGAGYSDIVAVGISNVDFAGQTAESGNELSGNETVTLVPGSEHYSPSGNTPPTGFGTSDAENLLFTVRATGLEASEVLIVRIDARFSCFDGPPTGNLHAAIASGEVTGTNDKIPVGQQDVPMLGLGQAPTATATVTPTATNTPTATATPTNTHTATATATNTPTETSTSTATATNTPTETSTSTATATDTPTETSTSTATATDTPTETSTSTPTATNTPTETATATATSTDTATATSTNTATATSTTTATATSTNTATPTSTNTATATPTGAVQVNSATPTKTRTPSPTSSPSPTRTIAVLPAVVTPTSPSGVILPNTGSGDGGHSAYALAVGVMGILGLIALMMFTTGLQVYRRHR